METNLNPDEEKLYDLLESKDWNALTETEKALVLRQMTAEEYSFQRRMLAEASDDLYPETEKPLPLVIPMHRKPLIQRSIPLYQALAAVAAVIVFFLLIRPAQIETPVVIQSPESVQQAQTTVQTVHDTVIRYVVSSQKVQQKVVDTIREFLAFPEAAQEPRMLEAANDLPPADLSRERLENRGVSLKEENTSHLLPKIVNTIY